MMSTRSPTCTFRDLLPHSNTRSLLMMSNCSPTWTFHDLLLRSNTL